MAVSANKSLSPDLNDENMFGIPANEGYEEHTMPDGSIVIVEQHDKSYGFWRVRRHDNLDMGKSYRGVYTSSAQAETAMERYRTELALSVPKRPAPVKDKPIHA